jgi:hypothetical protein
MTPIEREQLDLTAGSSPITRSVLVGGRSATYRTGIATPVRIRLAERQGRIPKQWS